MFEKVRVDKKINVSYPDKFDMKKEKELKKLGLSANAAKILANLDMGREYTQFDFMEWFDDDKKIKKVSKNKNPELKHQFKVAAGLKELRERGWIGEKEIYGTYSLYGIVKNENYPSYKLYWLKVDIIAEFEREYEKKINKIKANAERLKELNLLENR